MGAAVVGEEEVVGESWVLRSHRVNLLHTGVEVKGHPDVSDGQLSGVDIASNLLVREAQLFGFQQQGSREGLRGREGGRESSFPALPPSLPSHPPPGHTHLAVHPG